jgi:hypothetical protein
MASLTLVIHCLLQVINNIQNDYSVWRKKCHHFEQMLQGLYNVELLGGLGAEVHLYICNRYRNQPNNDIGRFGAPYNSNRLSNILWPHPRHRGMAGIWHHSM